MASSGAGIVRRPRTLRVPGHLNNSQLEQLLFGEPTRSGVAGAGEEDERVVRAVDGSAAIGSEVEAEGGSWAVQPARYPLNKQLAVFVVRDVVRLCCYMPEHIRALIAADDDCELRALTPPLGCVLTGAHGAFRLLIARLVRRLTGRSLSPSAVDELIAASQSIARHSLTMDTRTRHTYLLELYVPGADNVSLSADVLADSAAFRQRQERSWFASGQNPLRQLRLTYSIHALQTVDRLPCPHCQRKSSPHRTHWARGWEADTETNHCRALCAVSVCASPGLFRVSWYCPEDLCAVLPADVPLPRVQLPLRVDMSAQPLTALARTTPS